MSTAHLEETRVPDRREERSALAAGTGAATKYSNRRQEASETGTNDSEGGVSARAISMVLRLTLTRVEIRPLERLREVDERAARFTPMGFSTHQVMTAESAAEYHQSTISKADLTAAVPEGTRRSFERLRELHSYGVLMYDLYTVAEQLRPFVLEQALGERFVTYYEGLVPLQDKDGDPKPLEASSFDHVFAAVAHKGGTHQKARMLMAGLETLEFRGSFRHLLRWARALGLLRGQRNRFRDDILVELRNHFAHPTGYSLTGPVDSASAIRSLAETINHLWGVTTADGDRYAPPQEREVLAVGWPQDERALEILTADQLRRGGKTGWTYVLLRGVRMDGALESFDARYERTNFPTDLLWGPGSAREAIKWMDAKHPTGDAVDPLDRLFMIRTKDGRADAARRIEIAAGISGDNATGDWYLIRADFPGDALGHVRGLIDPNSKCASIPDGCPNCPATTAASGDLAEVLATFEGRHGEIRPFMAPDVRTPPLW